MKHSIIKILPTFFCGLLIFLFYFLLYPQAMSFQEQYQLFLWTGDYFFDRISVPGGFALYVGEFFTQFYYVEWLGALVLSFVFVLYYLLSRRLFAVHQAVSADALALIPVSLLLFTMGDENVLLSYAISLIFVMGAALIIGNRYPLLDILIVPLLYWTAGPMVMFYVLLRAVLGTSKRFFLTVAYLLYVIILEYIAHLYVVKQWRVIEVMFASTYVRAYEFDALPLLSNMLLIIVLSVVSRCERMWTVKKKYSNVILSIIAVLLTYNAVKIGFPRDRYELIKQDYLLRNERWESVISAAEEYTVHSNFWSESVNLALAMKHQLAERQFAFFQSGTDALLMPMERDMTSNLPTMEAFFRLGMVNESLRYAFDLQESIPKGNKSGRLCKRIAECHIINGNYAVARKYLHLLNHTLYYADWARKAEATISSEAMVEAHPVWGKLRRFRYTDDFLFRYDYKDKALGNLFTNHPENTMALEYFLAELLLRGDMQEFQKFLPWAEQYGGYASIPASYQDAMQCFMAKGQVVGSRYAEYARMMKEMMNLTR